MSRLVLAVVLSLLLVGGGCGPSDSQSPSALTDDLNRSVSLDRPVERVVSLAPNLTELVYAAGAGSTLVAVTTADDYPPAVDSLPRVSALPVDFEAIAAHNPDLVLATDQVNPPGDADTFAALNVPIYFFSFTSMDDVFDGLRRMGTLLGTKQAAADTARVLEDRLSALRAHTKDLAPSERPRVLVLVGDETLYSFGKDSYVHALVDAAGGRSITASLDEAAPTLSEEYVLTEQPDVIIGAWGADYDPKRLLALHPTWDVVPALQNDRVYSLPAALLLRPGPRLVAGAWQMAARLHPDRIPPSSSPDTVPSVSAPLSNSVRTP